MCSNAVPSNGLKATRISEREKLGVNLSSLSSVCFRRMISQPKKPGGPRHQPCLLPPSQTLPQVRANNLLSLSEIQRNRRECPLFIKRHKRWEM